MPPREGRPDRGPDPDGGHDLVSQFQVLIDSNKAILQAIQNQATDVAEQLHLQKTMGVGPGREEAGGAAGLAMQYRPQMHQAVIKQLTAHGALPSDPTIGMTKVSRTGALTSLQNLQAFTAQQLGERIARVNAPPAWKGLYPAEKEAAGGHAAPTPAAAAEPAPSAEEPPARLTPRTVRETLRAQPQPQPPPARPTLGGTLAPFGQQIMGGVAGAFQAVRGYAAGMAATPAEKPPATTPAGKTGTPVEDLIAASTEETAKATERLEAAVEKEKPPPGAAAALITPAPAGAPPAGGQKPQPPAGPAPISPVTTWAAERLAAIAESGKPAPGAAAPLITPPLPPVPPGSQPPGPQPPSPPKPPGQQPPGQQPPGQQPPGQQPPGPPPPGQPPVGPQPPGQQPTGPPRPSGQQPPGQQLGGWQNVGARVAMSGGSPGGVLGLLKKIPGVGLAVDVANMGAEQYQKQREAGRVYQEVEGGTNLGAQTERAHAFAYEASMFGRVPEGVAGQMFGDVTGMGFTQRAVGQGQQLQNRQTALNFMYHQYTATGTDPEQAAKILQTASQNATISLKSVGDAVTTLSDTAGKAGVNAKNARENFNNLLNTAVQVGAAGGAPQLAGAFANQQAQMGKAFAGTNMAGQMAPAEQYMLAGQTGRTPAQIQYMERAQPGEYARLVTGSQAQFINRLPGMTPAMMADLQSMIAAAGGAAALKTQPALAQDIATQFLNKYQASTPGMDLNVWAQYLSQVSGVPLTPGNVMQWVVTQVAGITPAASANVGAAGGRTGGAGGAGGGQGAPVAAGKTGGAATGKFGLAEPVGATGVAGNILHDVGSVAAGLIGGLTGIHPPVPSAHGSETWQQVLTGGQQGTAAKEYLGGEKKSGKRSPVLEALLQNTPKDAQVAVKTSAGTRVMSFADAMKYYPNELEAGQVQFYDKSGKNLGSTGTLTQGLTDPSADVTGEQSAKGAAAKAGVSLSQYQKKHPAAKGGDASTTAGGVTVDLSTEAKQLLKLLPGNSDNAAAAATAPQNPYNTSPSR